MRFVTLIKFTSQGVAEINGSTARARKFIDSVNAAGGQVRDLLWTQGAYDGLVLFDADDVESAAAITLKAAADGNVQTETMVAFDADAMDRILSKNN